MTADKPSKTLRSPSNRLSSEANWHERRELCSGAGIQILVFLYRIFGEPLARLVCATISYLVFIFDGALRQHSRKYLTKALGRPAKARDIIRNIWCFAYSIKLSIDFWMSPNLEIPKRWEDLKELRSCVDSGSGAVVLSAHFGPLESARSLSRHHPDLKLSALIHRGNSKGYRGLIARLDKRADQDVIPVETISPAILIDLQDRLARGESIALLGDRLTPLSPNRFIVVNFFGAPAPFPEGPFLLAVLLKAPIFILLPKVDNDFKELSFIAKRMPGTEGMRRCDALKLLAETYAQHLEAACREHPYLWFNFFDFWRIPAVTEKLSNAGL